MQLYGTIRAISSKILQAHTSDQPPQRRSQESDKGDGQKRGSGGQSASGVQVQSPGGGLGAKPQKPETHTEFPATTAGDMHPCLSLGNTTEPSIHHFLSKCYKCCICKDVSQHQYNIGVETTGFSPTIKTFKEQEVIKALLLFTRATLC